MAQPLEITLTIDLDKHLARHIGYDENGEDVQEATTVEDVIIGLAAQKLADRAVNGSVKDAYSALSRKVLEVRDALIAEQLRPLIEQAIARSVQPTNTFGEATGAAKPMSEVIVETATSLLTKATADRYNGPRRTLVQQWIADEVNATVKKELATALSEAKVEVTTALRAKGAEVLQETLKRAAGA